MLTAVEPEVKERKPGRRARSRAEGDIRIDRHKPEAPTRGNLKVPSRWRFGLVSQPCRLVLSGSPKYSDIEAAAAGGGISNIIVA